MDYTDQQVAKIVSGVLQVKTDASTQGPSMEYLADPHNEGIRLRDQPTTPQLSATTQTLSNDEWVRRMQAKTGVENLGWSTPEDHS